ncbi:MAG: undecaprenyl diphosphate synthase family protein [Steroidobacteraceae bacterium]
MRGRLAAGGRYHRGAGGRGARAGRSADPDLFIRTGGEHRISNFLLWNLAYTELFFTDCLWPDFDAGQLDAALAFYGARERRFGRTAEQTRSPASA